MARPTLRRGERGPGVAGGRAGELEAARREAARCRRCNLYRSATQAVFGHGRTGAALMLVGEQPGDVEDREGLPFVGPAGRLLREVLAEIGVDERAIYLTNAVKHFKWRPQGTRRIHDKPTRSEVGACGHWLGLELALVRPRLVVCLGATAAQALLGPGARVTALRGRVLDVPSLEQPVVVCLHPSAVLRGGDRRRELREQLSADLALARDEARAGARARLESRRVG